MSVAKCLGVDNLDASNMREAAALWPRWQEAEPTLDVVDDVHDLPRWMKRADPANRDSVLAALIRVAETDGRATLVLGWLLVPGASLLAGRLHRLADVIDEVVAGQLWIQICEHDPTDATYVAKKILSRVERETMASWASVTWPGVAIRRGRRRSSLSGTTSRSRASSRTSRSRGSSSPSCCVVRSTREPFRTSTVTCCWTSRMRRTLRVLRCGAGERD